MTLYDKHWVKTWKGGFWVSTGYSPYAWALEFGLWASLWSLATSCLSLRVKLGPAWISVGWARPTLSPR